MRTKLLNSGVYKKFNKKVGFVKKQVKVKAIKASISSRKATRKAKLKVSKKR